MRTSLVLLLATLATLVAMPALAQPSSTRNAATGGALSTLQAGDVAFGQVSTASPFFTEDGQNFHYEVFAYTAQAGERVTFSARAASFAPAVFVADGPGLNPDLPNQELSADGESARMDFYAPQAGTYTFAVLALEPEGRGPWRFQVRLDAQPPLDYAARYPGGGSPAERYALLVGVNDYPSNTSDLNGTVNDVMKVRAVLVERYGFRPENIVVLTNADATREHVIEAYRRHLGQAGPSGTALFYYSGHGTQIPDGYMGYDASDEADKLDEALVLWGTGGNFGFLVDEELGGLADALPAGHNLVILDNCHSGTGTRGVDDGLITVRELDMETDIGARADLPETLIAEAGDAGPSRHVLLAAAAAEQYSIEAGGLSEDGGSGGVFTYFLVNALKTADPNTSLGDLMEGVGADVFRTTEALDFPDQEDGQRPQAEGARLDDTLGAILMR